MAAHSPGCNSSRANRGDVRTGMSTASPPRGRRTLAILLFVAFATALVFYIRTCVAVAQQAQRDERRPADAIVVFGAAEYYGRPSPVLRLRLDHGLDLYREDLAPFVITTGGSGKDPHFSE